MNELQSIDIALVAVTKHMKKPSFCTTALDLFGVGQQAVKSANEMIHFIERMKWPCQSRKGKMIFIVEFRVCQKRLVCPEVAEASQIRCDNSDRQIRCLDCCWCKEIEHIGAAVQDQVVHQA